MPDTLRNLNARLSALGDELDAAVQAYDRNPTPETAATRTSLEVAYATLADEHEDVLTAHLEAQREEIAALAYDAAHTLPELLGRLIGEWDQDAEDHTDPAYAGDEPPDEDCDRWWDEGYRCGILAARDSLAKLLGTAVPS